MWKIKYGTDGHLLFTVSKPEPNQGWFPDFIKKKEKKRKEAVVKLALSCMLLF